MNTIKIKKLNPGAIKPTRAHEADAGLDIYAAENIVLDPQQKHLLSTGIAVDIPEGYVGLLTSRSGVSSETNLVIETGKIDAGFHGEMKINIKNDERRSEMAITQSNAVVDNSPDPLLYDIKGKKIKNNNLFNLARGHGRSHLIERGDKIAQLVIVPIVTPKVDIVEDFDEETDRGTQGFGSTDDGRPKLTKGGRVKNIRKVPSMSESDSVFKCEYREADGRVIWNNRLYTHEDIQKFIEKAIAFGLYQGQFGNDVEGYRVISLNNGESCKFIKVTKTLEDKGDRFSAVYYWAEGDSMHYSHRYTNEEIQDLKRKFGDEVLTEYESLDDEGHYAFVLRDGSKFEFTKVKPSKIEITKMEGDQ